MVREASAPRRNGRLQGVDTMSRTFVTDDAERYGGDQQREPAEPEREEELVDELVAVRERGPADQTIVFPARIMSPTSSNAPLAGRGGDQRRCWPSVLLSVVGRFVAVGVITRMRGIRTTPSRATSRRGSDHAEPGTTSYTLQPRSARSRVSRCRYRCDAGPGTSREEVRGRPARSSVGRRPAAQGPPGRPGSARARRDRAVGHRFWPAGRVPCCRLSREHRPRDRPKRPR